MPLGHTNNPIGRPPGSRNKRTQEVLDQIKARGDKDPLDALSEIITKNQDPSIVAQAANMLAPYVHSKRSAVLVPRYAEHPISVPEFLTVEDAEKFLGHIPVLVDRGELDFQSAQDFSTLTRNWLSAKYERDEMRIKMAAANAVPNPTITIKGGLPPLPGTSVIMPQLNGHQVNDTTLPLGPPDNGPCEPSSDAPVIKSIADDPDPPPSNETE